MREVEKRKKKSDGRVTKVRRRVEKSEEKKSEEKRGSGV